MIRVNVNRNIFPSGSGGYNFKDGDGSFHRGNSWPGVVRKVVAYRKRNKMPEGNAKEEVMAQACARNPTLCHPTSSAAIPAKKPASLKGRVLGWLSLLKKASEKATLNFVQDSEMRQRASVCAACPKNKSLPDGCNTCRLAVAELRKQLIGQNRLNEMDHRLMACDAVGCDLPSAAWLDEVRIHHDGLPGNCWRKAGVA